MRRLLAHAFSSKALRGQGDVVDHYVELFMKGLTERTQRGEVIDIVAWYNFASFDLIGHLALGHAFAGDIVIRRLDEDSVPEVSTRLAAHLGSLAGKFCRKLVILGPLLHDLGVHEIGSESTETMLPKDN